MCSEGGGGKEGGAGSRVPRLHRNAGACAGIVCLRVQVLLPCPWPWTSSSRVARSLPCRPLRARAWLSRLPALQVDMECGFGEVQNVELLPGGAQVPVERANTQQYVDLYTQVRRCVHLRCVV